MNKRMGKSPKLTLKVDPIVLKLIFRAAETRIKYMVEHDMMIHGSQCTDTAAYVAALKEFKKAL